jgi:hypothetical protein
MAEGIKGIFSIRDHSREDTMHRQVLKIAKI